MPAEVLVSAETGDDAAVWALGDGRALIATVDVFTPIVDDAYDWGRIAATNAFSDVYAMGGTPVMALNVVAGRSTTSRSSCCRASCRAGRMSPANAGVAVVGGHTITDHRAHLRHGRARVRSMPTGWCATPARARRHGCS